MHRSCRHGVVMWMTGTDADRLWSEPMLTAYQHYLVVVQDDGGFANVTVSVVSAPARSPRIRATPLPFCAPPVADRAQVRESGLGEQSRTGRYAGV